MPNGSISRYRLIALSIAAVNVKAYPTTIVISPERKVIAGLAGYVPVAGLTELLKDGCEFLYRLDAAFGPSTSDIEWRTAADVDHVVNVGRFTEICAA